MKVFLMYRDKEFGSDEVLPSNATELLQDLELNILLDAMAKGDAFVKDIARSALLVSTTDIDVIHHRQEVLKDCVAHQSAVREIYDIAVQALEGEKKVWGWMSGQYPSATLYRAIEVMKVFSTQLRELRNVATKKGPLFRSAGLRRFCEMIATEFDERYLKTINDHLTYLRFPHGYVMTAELGVRNRGVHYVLRKPAEDRRLWWQKVQDGLGRAFTRNRPALFYEIAERDVAGSSALSNLIDEGIRDVAVALAQSSHHILGFFKTLRSELAFYLGCLNLRDRLLAKGQPICFPEALPLGHSSLSGRSLYDPSLTLRTSDHVVGNDIEADGKTLIMLTGANRGGKSTLLRSVGVAQLMMQAGMFVAAEFFRADVRAGVFTHFKREEDASMKSGKLDEELLRMTTIIDKLSPHSLMLLNESFASTNEREGSEIARQIVRGLLESHVKIIYVTHLYDLSRGFYSENIKSALFLRAERLPNGQRTFQLHEGEPLPTSHGADLYHQAFQNPT